MAALAPVTAGPKRVTASAAVMPSRGNTTTTGTGFFDCGTWMTAVRSVPAAVNEMVSACANALAGSNPPAISAPPTNATATPSRIPASDYFDCPHNILAPDSAPSPAKACWNTRARSVWCAP